MRSRNGKSIPAIIFAAGILIFVCGVLVAADPVPVSRTIDLALPLNTDWSVPDNAKITITLIHKIPRLKYDVQYQKYTLNPAQIETDGAFKAEGKGDKSKPSVNDLLNPPPILIGPCHDLKIAVDHMTEGSETDVEAHLVALNALLLPAAQTSSCANVAEANQLIADTTQTIDISSSFPSLGADEGIIVTITRTGGPTPIPPSWVLDIHTGVGNGKFLSNYTFGFALNRDKSYFATTDAKIAEQVKRDKATMVPLVLFSWLPRNRATNSWIPSWTAGLGYDLSNPVVAVGGIWTWNRNLGIAVGLLGQKQQRLKGKYHVGDAVAANSESKDLTDPTWGPNVFVGISIRSVSALFK